MSSPKSTASPSSRFTRPISERGGHLRACLCEAKVTEGLVDALRQAGLTIVDEGDKWELSGPFGATTLDSIELAKLSLGVVFGGVSPGEIGERLMSSNRPESLHAAPAPSEEPPHTT